MGQLLSEMTDSIGLEQLVRDHLAAELAFVNGNSVEVNDQVPTAILDSIRRSINSKTKTYRYSYRPSFWRSLSGQSWIAEAFKLAPV